MTKKLLATSVVVAAMISLVGCGSSSSTDTSVQTGTAYYVDSAVSGVDYTCGAKTGVTGSDGAFTFEVGAGCTFYLDEIELRKVEAEVLVDGKKVYETDVEVARILQSLDTDADPSNGISVSSDIVSALVDAGITNLPDTFIARDLFLQVIETAGGTVVTLEDAAEHMLNTLLVGTTLYQHCQDAEGDWVASMTFGADGNLVMVDDGETETVAYEIYEDIIYTGEGYEEEAHIYIEATAEYIKFDEGNGEITTFYFTSEAALASPAMDCGGD